jgi:hypothetical protein
MHERDQQQAAQPPFEQPDTVSAARGCAVDEDGESRPEQEREEAVELALNEKLHQERKKVVGGCAGNASTLRRRNHLVSRERPDVVDENSEDRDAAQNVEYVDARRGRDRQRFVSFGDSTHFRRSFPTVIRASSAAAR